MHGIFWMVIGHSGLVHATVILSPHDNDVRGYYYYFIFLPSHSSKVLRGDGLVGGNPTMNTPRLRRGGG